MDLSHSASLISYVRLLRLRLILEETLAGASLLHSDDVAIVGEEALDSRVNNFVLNSAKNDDFFSRCVVCDDSHCVVADVVHLVRVVAVLDLDPDLLVK